MAPSRRDLIELCEILAQDNNLRVSVTKSMEGALYAATGALLGGLLGGPRGLAIGGSIGAACGAVILEFKFKSVVEIIMYEMTEEQKQKLADCVGRILRSFNAWDLAAAMAIVSSNASLKAEILKEIGSFLSTEMDYTLA